MFKLNENNESLFHSVFTAYVILILHVVLIAAIGFLILMFGGIISHMVWILLGMFVVVGASGYFFFKRLKAGGKSLGATLRQSPFHDRPVEVSLLGGLASLRIGNQRGGSLIKDEIAQGRFTKHHAEGKRKNGGACCPHYSPLWNEEEIENDVKNGGQETRNKGQISPAEGI